MLHLKNKFLSFCNILNLICILTLYTNEIYTYKKLRKKYYNLYFIF